MKVFVKNTLPKSNSLRPIILISDMSQLSHGASGLKCTVLFSHFPNVL